MATTAVKLNKWHMYIIEDRLVDCIIETMYDNDERQFEITKTMSEEEATDYITEKVESWLSSSEIDFSALNLMEQEILWNIVGLSTAACCMLDVCGHPTGYAREYRETCNAGRELAEALESIGIECEFSLI